VDIIVRTFVESHIQKYVNLTHPADLHVATMQLFHVIWLAERSVNILVNPLLNVNIFAKGHAVLAFKERFTNHARPSAKEFLFVVTSVKLLATTVPHVLHAVKTGVCTAIVT
jgi:hypothetical protein